MMTRSEVRSWMIAAACVALFPRCVGADDHPAVSPSPKAVEAMQLLTSEDPYQRQKGFLRLEALREPATIETIKAYVDHQDADMRASSVRALAAIQGAAAVPLLLEKLTTDRQPRVRRAALLGLEPLQKTSPDILPAFIKALRDHSPEVRMAAVDIVSRIDDPRAKQAISTRYHKERDHDVRRVLQLAMKRLKI